MNYLERLNIHPDIQSFFRPYLSIQNETLLFPYENEYEHAGPQLHRVPITESHWQAGTAQIAGDLIISHSALDTIAWLHQNRHRYLNFDSLYFLAIGAAPTITHAEIIKQYTPAKKLHFLFNNDPSGALCDLRLAAHVRNQPLNIRFDNHQYQIQFRNKHYQLAYLSLSALEKVSQYSFRIRTHKSKNNTNYHEQLRRRNQT